MRQYQISYENQEKFREQLAEIRIDCELTGPGDTIFYITWTKSAQAEVDTVTETIGEMFPDADYYGNEASGNIAMGRFTYGVNVTCYVFEGKTTRTELVWVERGTALSDLAGLWAYCRGKQDLRGIELIPSISYLEVLGIDRSVPDVPPDVLIFGGASVNYDDASYGADIIARGHPMTRDGMAVMLYYGTDLRFHASDILGWKGLGKPMEVTASTGKVIREIDRVPAFSVYEKYLNLTVDDRDMLVFPLIAEEDGSEFIRTPQIIRPDKSMLMFADIPEGTHVRISYGDKNTILNSLNDKAAEMEAYAPQAIKAYSCAARRLFWGDDEVGKETMVVQNIAPVCGFYTGGEILRFGGRLRVLNQTLALVSFREGDAEHDGRRKSFRHEEDKSLLSRLTYFAERIVEEEKEQRLLAEGFESVFKAQYQVMYYIDLRAGRATLLYGDEDAKKFLPIFDADSAETMFANFHTIYVNGAVVPEDRERVRKVMNAGNMFRLLKTGSSVSVNYRVRRNLVDPVYTEMRIIKAAEENGEVKAVILAFKLTDEELRTALETQRKMKEDARIIGALSEDFGCVDYVELREDRSRDVCVGVRTSDLLRRILPEWETAASFSEKLSLLTDRLVYRQDREDFYRATLREAILENLRKTDVYYINTRLLIDGGVRYYQVKISAVRDGEKLTGFVIGTRSVDENTRKEMEDQQQLQDALEKAEVANRSKTSFLFNMSHDIRTPMNAIRGFTAIARKYADRSETVKEYLDKIDISGQQLLTLINQVLEMSRIESGKIEFEEQRVDIRANFEAMITIVAAQMQSKGLEFRYALEDVRHNVVLADESRMDQITLNVVGNAIKYTPEGGRVSLRLKEVPSGKAGRAAFIFTVEDTGIGMSPEYLKVIFEPFSREKNSTVSRIQGTGLGMSIVKDLVDLMGGTIGIESEPGKGSRFDITLDFPIVEDGGAERYALTDGDVSAFSFKGRRILLVEDNEMNREIAKELLEDYGLLVEEAEDGDVAVDRIRGLVSRGECGYYDCILMDIQMPRMNGYDATRAIRTILEPEKTHVPIIAMTANAFEEDRRDAAAAGMDEHLAKPIDMQKMLETLARFL